MGEQLDLNFAEVGFYVTAGGSDWVWGPSVCWADVCAKAIRACAGARELELWVILHYKILYVGISMRCHIGC